MNIVILIGRLTKTPDIRYSQAGVAVCKFTLAVDRMKKDETDFFNIICFKASAEYVANYLDKGSLASVEGSIQNRNYDKDGRKVYVTEIIANKVQGLDGKKAVKQESSLGTELPFNAEDSPF